MCSCAIVRKHESNFCSKTTRIAGSAKKEQVVKAACSPRLPLPRSRRSTESKVEAKEGPNKIRKSFRNSPLQQVAARALAPSRRLNPVLPLFAVSPSWPPREAAARSARSRACEVSHSQLRSHVDLGRGLAFPFVTAWCFIYS